MDAPSDSKTGLGEICDLWKISYPLILSALSAGLMLFCDRLFLSHYSLKAFTACSAVSSFVSFFQLPLICLAWTIQVFVGYQLGAKKKEVAGSYVWQMLWISLASLVVTWPLGVAMGDSLLHGTEVEIEGQLYFYPMMAGNFLFPFAATLTAFFAGIGKTGINIAVISFSHLCNLLLDLLLIFGWDPLIEPMGTRGSALATIIAQGIQCALLLVYFLKQTHHKEYRTNLCSIHWWRLGKILRLGLPAMMGKIALLFGFVVLDKLIIDKGGDYLLMTAVGLTLSGILSCAYEGIGQGVVTKASCYLGANRPANLYRLMKCCFFLIGAVQLLLVLPLLVFPTTLLTLFVKEGIRLDLLRSCCGWIWLLQLFVGISHALQGILMSFGDTLFVMSNKIITFVLTDITPTWLAIYTFGLPASSLWMIMTASCAVDCIVYWIRARWKKQKALSQAPSSLVTTA